ncbi:MAG: universal stress protein [Desulfobacterota bacterium]|jgi:nucleotide-binding universal stress UspA family protein|nr:universal stress protein [Thermodesulfobacteriota bacterium]
MKEFKKILFPIDFSESVNKLIPYVLTLAQAFNSRVHLLYVARDFQYLTSFHVPHPSLDQLETEVLENAQKMITRVGEENFPSGYITRVLRGDAAGEIIRYAQAEKIDLIVMGTHGRKGLDRTLFGSVAANVVKNSPVPVMVINPHKV